jgi:homoserine dehydrogenase
MADATLYYGRGAGRLPTASAVVSDVVDIARRGDGPPPPPFVYKEKREVAGIGSLEGRYYLRLTTMDRVGVLGKVCTALGAHGVSIASCIQKEDHQDDEPVHVVLLTHETRESDVRAALTEIESFEFVREETMVLRVL